jgi:hypothetical protein
VVAQRVRGQFQLISVGGDARLEKIEGEVHLGSIAGDLRVVGLEGSLQAHVGGDASVSLATRPGTQSSLQAGGDIHSLFLRLVPSRRIQQSGRFADRRTAELSRERIRRRSPGRARRCCGAPPGRPGPVATAQVDPSDWPAPLRRRSSHLSDADAEFDAGLARSVPGDGRGRAGAPGADCADGPGRGVRNHGCRRHRA